MAPRNRNPRASSPARQAGKGRDGAGDEGTPAPSTGKRKASRAVVKAGGHVIAADPPAETPAESVQCSVCGQALKSGRCPNGHGADSGGWGVENEGEG